MTVSDCDGYDRILTVRPMREHRVTECVSAISVHVRSTEGRSFVRLLPSPTFQ